MATLFTKIINGEIPGAFVYQDDLCVAFLDVSPIREGHTMVVPREEVSHWIDAEQPLIDHLMKVARAIGHAQKTAFDCERIGVMIQGYEVPHLHIHVWPTNSMADFNLADRGPFHTPEQLAGPAEKIRAALDAQS